MNAYYTYTNVGQHFVHSHEDTSKYFVQPIQTKLLLRSITLDTSQEVDLSFKAPVQNLKFYL
jgi:hypothetical protein